MRVNIDSQCLTWKNYRGVAYYVSNLVKELLQCSNNDYFLSFFDKDKERNNRELIKQRVSSDIISRIVLSECNIESYLTIMSNATNNHIKTAGIIYKELFEKADVYHFPVSTHIGCIVPDNSIVTVNDVIPKLFAGNGWCSEDDERRFDNAHKYLEERKDIELVAISNSTRKDLCSAYNIDEKRVHVIYDAYDSDNCFPQSDSSVLSKYGIDTSYILYLGALDYRKGIVEILTAFEHVAEKRSDIKLVLAGGIDPNFKKYLQLIEQSKAKKRIVCTGYVSDYEKRILLSSAEMFLFPSLYEGFGIPVLEAMACGCPVITTNVSSLPEVCENAAIYVGTHNSEELEQEIVGLLDDEQKRKNFSLLGLEQCQKFSWKETASKTNSLYWDVYNR